MATSLRCSRSVFWAVLLAGVAFCSSSPWDSFRDGFLAHFKFLPESHFEIDVKWFHLHKDSLFRAKYVLKVNTSAEAALVAFRETYYFFLRFDAHTGVGKQEGPILFDPRDINLNLVPFFEFRKGDILAQCGLEHRCFHEIDRKESPTVYWNKPYFLAGSLNMRLSEFGKQRGEETEWELLDRFAWYIKWGYFVQGFFDILQPVQVNGGHDFVQQTEAMGRFSVYRFAAWDVTVRGYTSLLSDTDHKWYWLQELGVEGIFQRERRGIAFFMKYHFDLLRAVPVFSKDRLLELGFRVFM